MLEKVKIFNILYVLKDWPCRGVSQKMDSQEREYSIKRENNCILFTDEKNPVPFSPFNH